MQTSVTRLKLDNGLLVLLKEIHTSPIISQWIWYRVGSRDEVTGMTGISHWVEHMQFKGTPNFPAGSLDKRIAREGGSWNALTYLDWTTYYETMPAHTIDLALELEVDRMTNSAFGPEEVDSERNVIISERQGSENDPQFLLSEQVQQAAFFVHPYHHEIIGDLPDLQSMQRADLYHHYRTYYTPTNAVLSLAGDFKTDEMLDRIRGLYASVPASEPPKRLSRPEPDQPGERRVEVEGPGETTYVEVAYRAPAASHPDFYALTLLDSLLSGASGLNMFGGGLSNKTSRLYRALVDQELALSVGGGFSATIDPYLFSISMTLHPERSVDALMTAFDEQVERLQQEPPLADELRRALKQARALFAYGSESITNQAFWLGFAEMFASYDWFTAYLDRLSAVTPQQVQRVAQTYLRPQSRVVGVYRPNGGPSEETEEVL